jgi:hypothetical protein
VAKQLWTDETNSNVVFIDSINFCDGTFTYNNIDRIGGLLSHLKKTYRNQLGAFLGADHPVMTNDSYEQIQSDFQDICKKNLLRKKIVSLSYPSFVDRRSYVSNYGYFFKQYFWTSRRKP